MSSELLSDVKCVKRSPESKKLTIHEALTFVKKKSDLNRQIANFINPLNYSLEDPNLYKL